MSQLTPDKPVEKDCIIDKLSKLTQYLPEIIYSVVICILILVQCSRLFCCMQKIKQSLTYPYALTATILSAIMIILVIIFGFLASYTITKNSIKLSLNFALMLYFIVVQGFTKLIMTHMYKLLGENKDNIISFYNILKEIYILEITTQCVNVVASVLIIGILFYKQFNTNCTKMSSIASESTGFILRILIYVAILIFSGSSLGCITKLITSNVNELHTSSYNGVFYTYITLAYTIIIIFAFSFVGFKYCKPAIRGLPESAAPTAPTAPTAPA